MSQFDGETGFRPAVRDRRPGALHLFPQALRPAAPAEQVRSAADGRLSRVQTSITRLVAEGMTDARIAVEMGWTERAVSTEIRRARWRLGAENRAHLAAIAIRSGLID